MSNTSNQTVNSQPHRRSFAIRFGLRSLGFLVLLIAFAFAYASQRMNVTAAEQQAIARLQEVAHSLEFQYDYQFKCESDDALRMSNDPDVPKPNLASLSWFSRLMRKDYDSRIVGVRVFLKDGDPESIELLRPFSKLQSLEVHAPEIGSVNLLGEMSELTHLVLSSQCGATDISSIEDLTQLRVLKIALNEVSTPCVNALKNKPALEYLRFNCLKSTSDLEPLKIANGLRKLNLMLADIDNLAGIENLKNLEELYLSENKNLVDIQSVGTLASLEKLSLANNDNVEDLSPIGELKMLKGLDLSFSKVKDFRFVKGLPQLEVLNLVGTHSIESLDGLQNLKHLIRLNLTGSDGFRTLDGLQGIKKPGVFNYQTFTGCKTLVSLNGLAATAVTGLDLSGCSALKDISVLREAKTMSGLKFFALPFDRRYQSD